MIKKVLRPSLVLLALTLFITPVSRMYADGPCDVVTGCDPVPPPAAPGSPDAPSVISIILFMMGLS